MVCVKKLIGKISSKNKSSIGTFFERTKDRITKFRNYKSSKEISSKVNKDLKKN